MQHTRFKAALALVCALLLPCPGLRAQVTTATIYGTVLDPAGAVVTTARVQATNMQTSVSVSAATNDNGNFTIPFVPIGAYTVTVQASGFKVYEARNIELSASEKVNLNISLQIGGTTETVEVSAQASLVNSVNAEQDVDLNTHRVHELPLLNRDITRIVDLGTGSSTDGTSISLNGLPPRGFSFTIDGVDASPDSEYPSLSLYQNINFIKGVSLEAVQEVHVSKNIFSAEIADTVSGNVNLITKGGTNQYHGSAFEDYESGGLDAINHLLSRGSSRIFHQFGGSVGGPIKKDKLFFFAALEAYRFNQQQPLTGQVPSLQVRTAIEAALPLSKPYFDGWPLPTSTEKPGDVSASYVGTGVAQNTDNQGTARGDYLFNQNNRVNVRYTEGRPTQLQPRINFGNPRTFDGLNRNVSSSYDSVWSPTMTGETRFGYNLDDLARQDAFYNLSVPTITGAGLPDPSQARLFVKNGKTITAEESIAKTLGRHSLKFGGMYRFQSAQRVVGDLPSYSFSTLADILANQPATGTYTFFPQTFNLRRWFTGFFVQDDFRVNQRLIINAGLRWDYQSVPQEEKGLNYNRDGPFGPYRNPDSPWRNYYKMFSPRLALAWTVDNVQRTVVRVGGGIFYIPMNFFEGPVEIAGIDPNVPQAATISGVQLKNLGAVYPDGNSKVQSAVKASNIIGVTAIDPNWRPSYSLQWTAGIEHAFTNTLAWNVSYVANHGVRLLYDAITNGVDRVTGLPANPGFSTFRYYQNGDSSTYQSLQTSLKKRFARGLQFDIGYTYASNMSYFLGDYNCCGEDNNPQDLSALKQNRAPTLYFLRHRFTGDFVYAVPSLRPSHAVARKILSGWEVGGVFQAHSGNPLPVIESITASPGARPDFAPGFTYQSAVSSTYRTALPNGTYQYLNTDAFIRIPTSSVSKAAVRPGNLGRNAIFGPGLWNTDLSLAKNVAFTERYKMQLRGNFFNALNHTNYTTVQTNVLSSQFGQITGVMPGRALQLVARFMF